MPKYTLNDKVFDVIDTAEKAYWLGFLWCDASVIKRVRKSTTYEFKLDLSEIDHEHVEALKKFLEATHPVKIYQSSSQYRSDKSIVRLYISQNQFGRTLQEKYGLIPGRTDTSKVTQAIPDCFVSDFIRGIIDADGSIVLSTTYCHKNSQTKKIIIQRKAAISFTTSSGLVEFVMNHLLEKGLIKQRLKTSKRHKESDGDYLELKIAGNLQIEKILDYLYKDSTIHLNRKYVKYLEIKEHNNR